MKLPYFKILMLLALQTCPLLAAEPKPISSSPPAKDLGWSVYETNCLMCHGEKGDGKGRAAVAIPLTPPRDFTAGKFKFGSEKEQIFKTISEGIPNTPMPSWKHLSEADRRAVVETVLNFSKK